MSAAPPAPRTLRLYETLRTAHLERLATSEPGAVVAYRHANYDFDAALAGEHNLRHVPRKRDVVDLVLHTDIDVLEINEPLMRAAVLRSALALTCLHLRERGRRRRTNVVTYAIANRDTFGPPLPTDRRGRLRRRLELAAARRVMRRVDRIAYGTSAAQELYGRRLDGYARGEAALVPALPSQCACGALQHAAGRVVFVGDFSVRKGIPTLLEAWPLLAQTVPDATLTVVGKGALRPQVETLASSDPRVTLVIDPPRDDIHALLRDASVVVLLSQPTPKWREQVGLPLVEGLAHGCRVVASDQTGLAEWLAAHGHGVIAAEASPEQLADAIVSALADDASAAQVCADLPSEDGRLTAERWMFSRAESVSTAP